MRYARGTLLWWKPNPVWDLPLYAGEGSAAYGTVPIGFGHVGVAAGDGEGNATGTAIQAIGSGIGAYGFQTPDATLPYPGDVEAFMAALEAQVGHGYDYLGLLCVPAWRWFRRCPDGDYRRTSRRFCSSLIVDAIRRGDPSIKDCCAGVPSRAVSPNRLYNWTLAAQRQGVHA